MPQAETSLSRLVAELRESHHATHTLNFKNLKLSIKLVGIHSVRLLTVASCVWLTGENFESGITSLLPRFGSRPHP